MQTLFYETVDSTNEAAKRLIQSGEIAQGPTIIWAREQTAGKGTRGRRWASPANAGLYLSVVHGGEGFAIDITTTLTLSAGVACAEVLESLWGVPIRLKPVNDLYVNGCKLGGILVESLISEGRIKALITGIGINLSAVERSLEDPNAPAISLEEVLPLPTFQALDSTELAQLIASSVDTWHQRIFTGQIALIEQTFESYALKPAASRTT